MADDNASQAVMPVAQKAHGDAPVGTKQHAHSRREVHTEPKTFRLLDLPPELWIKIGEYAVSASPIVTSVPPFPHLFEPLQRDLRPPAICFTCRVVRSELVPYFYAHQFELIFWCEDVNLPLAWLRKIGAHNRRHLRQVSLRTKPKVLAGLEGVFHGMAFEVGPGRSDNGDDFPHDLVYPMYFK